MLSVRLSDPLESQLSAYCESAGLSKSAVVQIALEKHLKRETLGVAIASRNKRVSKDPLLALVGSGNRKYSTEQVMRMMRGDDWNQP